VTKETSNDPASVKDSRLWKRIATAPKDGTHILGAVMDGSNGLGYGVPIMAVVHWWDNPGERGWYTSVNELEPENPLPITHWRPLPATPDLLPCGCVRFSGEWCAECY